MKKFFKDFNKNVVLPKGTLIYGKHPFFSILKAKKRKIYKIYISEKNKNEFYDFLKENNDLPSDNLMSLIEFVDNQKLDSIFPYKDDKNHQGYIIFVGNKQEIIFDDFINSNMNEKELPKLIILDQILDPHNLGAIIRTAAAFGIYDIIITSRNSTKDTATVAKSSAGLNELVNLIEVGNLNSAIKDLKNIGYFIIGLDGEAKVKLTEIKDNKNIALVLGNEGKGIRELVKKNCDDLVKIPMQTCVESLNVSVASAIAMYEFWNK